jgi:hypothetical protein
MGCLRTHWHQLDAKRSENCAFCAKRSEASGSKSRASREEAAQTYLVSGLLTDDVTRNRRPKKQVCANPC